MPNNVDNVTTGKPKVGGALHRAPLGTALPTDATTALNAAFKGLGYISEDGVTVGNSIETEETKAWGGDTVLEGQKSSKRTVEFTMLESTNPEVLKAVYVDENVTGTLADGITVKANAKEQPECCWVVDMVLKGGGLKRIAVPRGKVTEVGDVQYVDNKPVGYKVKLSCLPDGEENAFYEYIKGGAAG
jgi:hypothetical protein